MNIYEATKKGIKRRKIYARKLNQSSKSEGGRKRRVHINEVGWKPPCKGMGTNIKRVIVRRMGNSGIR